MGNQPSNQVSSSFQKVKRAMSSKLAIVDGGSTVTNSKLYENDYNKQLVAKGTIFVTV